MKKSKVTTKLSLFIIHKNIYNSSSISEATTLCCFQTEKTLHKRLAQFKVYYYLSRSEHYRHLNYKGLKKLTIEEGKEYFGDQYEVFYTPKTDLSQLPPALIIQEFFLRGSTGGATELGVNPIAIKIHLEKEYGKSIKQIKKEIRKYYLNFLEEPQTAFKKYAKTSKSDQTNPIVSEINAVEEDNENKKCKIKDLSLAQLHEGIFKTMSIQDAACKLGCTPLVLGIHLTRLKNTFITEKYDHPELINYDSLKDLSVEKAAEKFGKLYEQVLKTKSPFIMNMPETEFKAYVESATNKMDLQIKLGVYQNSINVYALHRFKRPFYQWVESLVENKNTETVETKIFSEPTLQLPNTSQLLIGETDSNYKKNPNTFFQSPKQKALKAEFEINFEPEKQHKPENNLAIIPDLNESFLEVYLPDSPDQEFGNYFSGPKFD